MRLAAIVFVCSLSGWAQQAAPFDLNTALMETTFEIRGQTGAGESIGTAFILGIPLPDDSSKGRPVLVTATHVLSEISADTALLIMRRRDADHWQKQPLPVHIRENGRPLWVQHPNADVAVVLLQGIDPS